MKISKTGFPFSQPLKRPEHLPPRESERKEKGEKKKKGRQQTGPSHPQHQREQHWSGGIGRQRAPSLPRKQIKKGIQNKVKKGIQNKVKNGTQNK